MKKTSSLILASMLILGGISTASPAFAVDGSHVPDTGDCKYITETVKEAYDDPPIHHDAVAAVYETKVIKPAVTETLYLYEQHQTGKTQWKPEGWNGIVRGEDNGKGWHYVVPEQTQLKVITEAKTEKVLVKEAVAAYDEKGAHHEAETRQVLVCVDKPPAPTTVVPHKPTYTPGTCDKPFGEVTFEKQEGVVLSYGPKLNSNGPGADHAGAWVISFHPEEGYKFNSFEDGIFNFPVQEVDHTKCVTTEPTAPAPSPSPSATNSGTVTIPTTQPTTAAPSTEPVKAIEPSNVATTQITPSATSSVQPLVAPVTTSAAPPAQPEQLAYTGADKTGWAVVGGILLLLGLLFLVAPKLLPNGKH